MTASPGKNAGTYKGSLIGKRIKADQANAGKYFERAIGHREFDVTDSFIVTADNQDDPQARVIIFEDSHGRVATGVASCLLVMELER
jgi:hypothetical protein